MSDLNIRKRKPPIRDDKSSIQFDFHLMAVVPAVILGKALTIRANIYEVTIQNNILELLYFLWWNYFPPYISTKQTWKH